MAKHDKEGASPNTGTATAAANPPAAPPTANASDDRHILITLDQHYPGRDGTQVKRIDLIRELWQNNKMGRGPIAKECTRLQGLQGNTKKVTYQIVFAATKDLEGGPAKPAPAEAGEQA
jgi:hypothetical protein